MSAGQAYVVGEKRPEVFVPDTAGRIIADPSRMAAPASSSGGSVTVPISININAAGADPAAVARLTAVVAQMKSDMPSMVVKTVRDAKKRRLLN